MRRILSVLCVLIGLCAAACGRTDTSAAEPFDRSEAAAAVPASAERLPGLPRIVFLGDSLTAGLGLPREQAVSSLVQRHLDAEGFRYEVVNAGVSGDTSAGGLSRLEWSLEGNVRILVLELGANDGLRGLPVDELKKNLAEIITRAKARDITVLLTGMEAPPNYGPAYTSSFRRVFSDLAREHGVPFMPFYLDGVAGIGSLNNPDGIHPNAAGSVIIEKSVWRALQPLLARPSSSGTS